LGAEAVEALLVFESLEGVLGVIALTVELLDLQGIIALGQVDGVYGELMLVTIPRSARVCAWVNAECGLQTHLT
jgi:hypothetical protein